LVHAGVEDDQRPAAEARRSFVGFALIKMVQIIDGLFRTLD
jgi:hypothetical protein